MPRYAMPCFDLFSTLLLNYTIANILSLDGDT